MKKYLGNIARSLRATAVGAMALLFEGVAAPGTVVEPFIDRARERVGSRDSTTAAPEQLVMEPANYPRPTLFAGHSSHRSHRSHSSHSSGGGSWTPSPSPAPRREPAPVVTLPPSPTRVVVPRKTTLRVKSTPQARVLIDGKLIGTTPTAAIEVFGASVDVQLEHRLLGTVHRNVALEAGKDNSVDIKW